jgi:hypothetical protein
MKRFRWTRSKYRHAQHLARLFCRFYILPDDAPEIVRLYFELWEEHPQHEDPLLRPISYRYDPAIPF